MSLIRIGAVSYMNTKPLVFGLDAYDHEVSVEFDLPSRLADRLAAGDLDVGLIPVIETAADPGYTVVSDAAIACRGPVKSVKLVSRVEPQKITTLALDEGSRTSVALSRVILAMRHGVEPICNPLPIEADWRLMDVDACLIIGDRAMHPLTTPNAKHGFCFEWDLGRSLAAVDWPAIRICRLGRETVTRFRSSRCNPESLPRSWTDESVVDCSDSCERLRSDRTRLLFLPFQPPALLFGRRREKRSQPISGNGWTTQPRRFFRIASIP